MNNGPEHRKTDSAADGWDEPGIEDQGMRSLWAYSTAFAAGAAIAWGLGAGSDRADAGPPPPKAAKPDKVGFVDLDEVYDKYFKKEELYKEMEKSVERLRGEIVKIDAQIRDLQKEMSGTVQTREKQLPIQQSMVDLRARQQQMRERAELDVMWLEQDRKKAIRADIVAEVQALASEQGFTLILNRAVVVELPAAQGQPAQPQRRSVVVFSEPQHNLTEAVLTRLNKKSNGPAQNQP